MATFSFSKLLQAKAAENAANPPQPVPVQQPPKPAEPAAPPASRHGSLEALLAAKRGAAKPETGGKDLAALVAETKSSGTLQTTLAQNNQSTAEDESAALEGEIVDEEFDGLLSSFTSEDEAAKEFQFPGQPEGFLSEHVAKFKSAVELLHAKFEDPQSVSTAIGAVIKMCDEHPELRDYLLPEDYGMMVMLIRDNYQTVVMQKDEKTQKRTTKKLAADEAMKALENMNFDLS